MNLARALLMPMAASALLCATSAHAQQPIRAGQTLSGELTSSDPVLTDNSHFDLYVYRGRAGERITITLMSDAFDAFLGGGPTAASVDTDDDGAGGTNSRLTATVGPTGQYVIRVNTLTAGETGRYSLSVQGGGGGDTPAPTPRPTPAPAPSGGTGAIRAGETVNGTLDASDNRLEDGSYFDLYTYRGRAGERITITLMSDAFDAFLGGGPTSASVDSDDDGAGGTNARLVATVGPTGQYVIRVNTLSAGETGRYSLSLQAGGAPAPNPTPNPTPGPRPTPAPAGGRTSGGGAIRAGETVSGTLASSDTRLDDGSFFDLYTYRGTPGERITVTMSSSAFDAYLSGGTVRGGSITPEASNDDGAGGTNARMVAVVGAGGEFGIRANSVAANSTGAYTLRVESAGGGGGTQAGAGVIRAGTPQQGRLAAGDPKLSDDSFYDLFTYQGTPGEQIEVTLSSSDFDAYLGGGEDEASAVNGVDRDDDGAGGTNSQLRVTVGSNGRYVIRANSLQGNVTGAYTLAVRSTGGGGGPVAGNAIRRGQAVSGRLDASDPTLQDGSHYDLYTYQGQPGEEIVIRLESTAFDPFLSWGTVFGSQFQRLAQDDDSGPGSNAELRVRLDRSGTYAIQANSFGRDESGAYTLRVDAASDVAVRTETNSGMQPVAIGQTVSGQLTRQDRMLGDSSYADLYVYRGQPGDQVRATLRSTAFDSYLAVGTTDGESTRMVASDDDSGGGRDAQLQFTVAGNGTYAIQVNSFEPRATGAYTLLLERGSAASPTPAVGTNPSVMSGKWMAGYPAVRTPRYNPVRTQLQGQRRMEAVAEQLNASFPLPRNVPLLFGECGEEMGANAYYSPREGSVTFCYEMLEYLNQGFQGIAENPQDLAERVNGAVDFIMLHEVGHALVHQLDLPITGREEDVADQLAALVLLQDGDKGANAALSGAMALQSEGAQFDNSDFADEHSLGPQRLFNIACWIYGSEPAKYQRWVTEGILPAARARRCPAEYEQMTKSWTRLLGRPLGN